MSRRGGAVPRHGRARLHRRLDGPDAGPRGRAGRRASTSAATRAAAPDHDRRTSSARVTFVAGDITDLDAVERASTRHGITNVIHLAALQVPFCRADPPLGARVNVVGTVNVFEAVKRRRATAWRRSSTRARSGCSRPTTPTRRRGRLDGRCRAAPAEPLRRLQAGQRGQRPDLLARRRACRASACGR